MKETNLSMKSKIGTEIAEKVEKRTYQKRKIGFTIAVEHKLNTKIGPELFETEQELYPIYVEVRVKGHKTFFRSRFKSAFTQSEFDTVLKNDFVKLVMFEEANAIRHSIAAEYELLRDSFSVPIWYAKYVQQLSDQQISNIMCSTMWSKLESVAQENLVDNSVIVPFRSFYRHELEHVIRLLLSFGVKSVDPIVEFIDSYSCLEMAFLLSQKLILNEKFIGRINVFNGLTMSDLKSGFFELTLNHVINTGLHDKATLIEKKKYFLNFLSI